MLTVRPSAERGRANLGWLDSRHTFSFADYYDPAHMGISDLRVINEDRVQPGAGFGTHGHRDMEIISYVLEGALEHKDSLGNGSVIHPGDVQRMSAGTGVRHSEYNHSKTELVHFLQIWILPNKLDLTPSYEQRHFSDDELRGGLRLIASPDGRHESATIHQDALLYAARFDTGEAAQHALAGNRSAYVHVVRGAITINGKELRGGDGVAAQLEKSIECKALEPAEFLLFDLR